MNLGGIKISSAEIERVLNQVDGVIETAAVAHRVDSGPDQLIVFAVTGEGTLAATILARMNASLKKQLNPLFKIGNVEIVSALPRTASGKIMRRVLRDGFDQP